MKNELQLFKIEVNEKQEPTMSARELHEFLEIKTKYKDWFPRMCEYGFIDGQDFVTVAQKRATAQGNETSYNDHAIKIDMAKEISMIQRSDKGKEARQYFLQIEKDWNSPEKIMARALIMATNQIHNLEQKIEEQKSLVVFAETCIKSKDNILVRQVSKIAQDEGINIGEKKLYNKLREWGLILKFNTEPSQTAMNGGYFIVEEKPFDTPYGVRLNRTTKVTPKGQVYIIEKLKREVVESK